MGWQKNTKETKYFKYRNQWKLGKGMITNQLGGVASEVWYATPSIESQVVLKVRKVSQDLRHVNEPREKITLHNVSRSINSVGPWYTATQVNQLLSRWTSSINLPARPVQTLKGRGVVNPTSKPMLALSLPDTPNTDGLA